jgi:hypothetical protein
MPIYINKNNRAFESRVHKSLTIGLMELNDALSQQDQIPAT